MYWKGDTAREVRDGGVVILTDSGTVAPVRNDSSNDRLVGVARRNDTVTDSALVPVEVPVESAVEWIASTDSDAGAADSDVSRLVTIDTTGGNSVNAGDSCGLNVDVSDSSAAAGPAGSFAITGIVSATQVIGVLPHTMWHQTYDTAA